MENFSQLTELGGLGIALAILFFIVRYFVAAMKEKDKYIVETTKDFTTIVGNHIDHSTAAMKENTKVINKLCDKLD